MCKNTKKLIAFCAALILGIAAVAASKRFSAEANADYYESAIPAYVSARDFTPTERKLMAAIRKVKIRQTEEMLSRRNFSSEVESRIREQYGSRETTEFLELQIDILNAFCTDDNLSDAACEARKLEKIREIEENTLTAKN